ncbi:MAG: RIP metalloprotease RseP [Clostridia bacterium]|nr:RIP metalloprotease RseP [Clostridia bacterium]
MQVVFNIVITVLVFGLLILSHEAGHFFTAIWAKIKVHEFSIGMGPAIYKRDGKLCRFSIRALPIGGYVQMEGEDGDSDDENSFTKKPKWKRFLVLVMGAAMNILMGFILICCINATMEAYHTTVVAQFDDDAVSVADGLQVGDKIVSIDGYRIFSFMDISYALSKDSKAEDFDITVQRDGEKVQLNDVHFPKVETENYGSFHDIDFKVFGKKRTIFSLLEFSAGYTVSVSRSIYSFVGSIFTFEADLNQVSGPVGTAQIIGESATTGGLISLLLVVAMISINLGIMNLLPFPALDGGRILLLLIEAIRRKPLNPKIETALNGVGLVLLMGLMLLVTFKDIIGLF